MSSCCCFGCCCDGWAWPVSSLVLGPKTKWSWALPPSAKRVTSLSTGPLPPPAVAALAVVPVLADVTAVVVEVDAVVADVVAVVVVVVVL